MGWEILAISSAVRFGKGSAGLEEKEEKEDLEKSN
jgi:hypothetical protein